MKKLIITTMCACLALTAIATEIPGSNGVPDLPKGGTLKRVNIRWVGPVGIFGGMWRPRGQKMEDVRQLQVVAIEKGSPADGVLQEDDVILGADGTGAARVPLFEGASWSYIPIANAITEAEARNPAILKLLVWRPAKETPGGPPLTLEEIAKKRISMDSVSKSRKAYTDGKTMTVSIKLQPLGRYSDTAPYNCSKSKNVLRQGIKYLYESDNPGKFNLGILCLLAADDPSAPDNDKIQARAKEWMHKLITEKDVGGGAWESGVKLIILSEYYMKTGDKTVFPYLTKQAEHHASGVSWFGTTGHRFCEKKPDGSDGGKIGGYGPINCSGAQGFLGLSLARKAGVKSAVVDAANERQRIFFGHFAFRGGPGYGEMPYSIGAGASDPNGRSGMPALALGLQENQEAKAKYYATKSALSPYNHRISAHGGPFFGQLWSPIASAQGGQGTTSLKFNEIRWHLDLKRRPNGDRIHDPTHQKYGGFCNGATALIFYAMPLKNLYITGRGQKDSLKLTDAEAAEALACKSFDVKEASDQELITAIPRFLGMQRGAIARELSERCKAAPESAASAGIIEKLLTLAADANASPTARTGACKVFQIMKSKAGDLENAQDLKIVKTMVSLLKGPDPYIRFGGMRALQAFHPDFSRVAVKPYANQIMDAIIATGRPTFPLDEEDPLQWAHGEMGAFLFGTVLAKELDGVDRTKFVPALRSALMTANGHSRNLTSRFLKNLNMEEARELSDILVDNIKFPPPGNSMGGSGAPNAQAALANHLFEEALPLSLIYGGSHAIKNKIPEKYGSAAFGMQSSRELVKALGKLMIIDASLDSNKILAEMKKAPAPEQMLKLKRIDSIKAADPTLTLPMAKTELSLDATNYGCEETATTYTWRKVYGAGKVSFAPNGSAQSKTTTVSFTDQKPGKYRFEVTMSDTLGLNKLTETVDVTLLDKRGKLPSNKPPQAKSMAFAAVTGRPIIIRLSGTDPDGDDLGFVVTRKPAHGRISMAGAKVAYAANFGFNGVDNLTFNAVDGQGETAEGEIQFKVSDQNVGVAVYEGFDYSSGAIEGRGGDPSFGFSGSWTNSKGTKDFYIVGDGSTSYTALPSTGGKLLKGQRWWPASRSLDTAALSKHKLLDNGNTLWFSMFVEQPQGMLFRFTGPDISFGLAFESRRSEIHTTFQGEKAGDANNPYSRSAALRFPKGPHLIVGRCAWGKTDEDPDTMKVFRVFDAPEFGPLVLEEPVCVLSKVIPQEKIGQVWMKGFEQGSVDEFRIGPTLHSVMVGTKPLKAAQ